MSAAARYEAAARELDLLAATSSTALGRATWRAAADDEMAKAKRFLPDTCRITQATVQSIGCVRLPQPLRHSIACGVVRPIGRSP